MFKFLKREKVPYLLIVLLGIIGFQFNYIANSINKIPFIEYRFREFSSDSNNNINKRLVLTNITTDKVIKNLRINLAYDTKTYKVFTDAEPEIEPITSAAIITTKFNPSYIDSTMLYFPLPYIQPGAAYEISFQTNSKENPMLLYESTELLQIKERSIFTFTVKYQFEINLILLFLFMILFTLYIIKLSSKNENDNNTSNTTFNFHLFNRPAKVRRL
ncbi:MAG: hypothetical protein QM802_07160 [Agriterribacter sp.]